MEQAIPIENKENNPPPVIYESNLDELATNETIESFEKPSISADTLELLSQLNITHSDLEAKKIRLEDLDLAIHANFFQKLLRFLMSTSLIRTTLLWPLLRRYNIKLIEKSVDEMTYLYSIQKGGEENLDPSGDQEKSDEDIVIAPSHQPSDPSANLESGNIDPLELTSRVNTLETSDPCCTLPIFTTAALLIERESALKKIFGIIAFYETGGEILKGLWGLLISSLLIQGIINFYLYPKERELGQQTIWDVLGLTNPYATPSEQALINSLTSPFVLISILGPPLIFGAIQAIINARDTKALNKLKIQKLLSKLKKYQPGFWTDGLGWVFSALIPDACPPAILFYLLPQPTIKKVLEKIKQRIIWDGRFSARERWDLFDYLHDFAGQQTRFTQMKALSLLAEITDDIEAKNFTSLKQAGKDDETLKVLLGIKTKGFHRLHFFANHYNLPGTPKSLLRPLPRYLYANYLMWLLGQPQNHYLQPLFFFYKGVKLYYQAIFILYFFTFLNIDMRNAVYSFFACIFRGGKVFWINGSGFYCNFCPALPYLMSHNSPPGCIDSYLKVPQTLESLSQKNIVKLFSQFDDDDCSRYGFDLSQQNLIIQRKELAKFLALTTKEICCFNKLSYFIIKNNPLSIEDMHAIASSLHNITISPRSGFRLILNNNTIENGGIQALLETLQNRTTDWWELDLSNNKLTEEDSYALATFLSHSDIGSLVLDNTGLRDKGISLIANQLTNSTRSLSVRNCNITSQGCITLAERLFNIQLSQLLLSDNPVDSGCAQAIANTLCVYTNHSLYYLELTGNHFIDDQGIEFFANAFIAASQKKCLPLDIFYFSSQNASDEVLIHLLHAITLSHISGFDYTDNNLQKQRNYTVLIPTMINYLNSSKNIYSYVSLGWHAPQGNGLADEGIQYFTQLITEQKYLPSTHFALDFSNNQIGPQGAQILASAVQSFVNSGNLIGLKLNNNHIGKSITAFNASILFPEGFSQLDLSNNNITAQDISALTDAIRENACYSHALDGVLQLSHNPIEKGIFSFFKIIGKSCFNTLELKDINLTDQSAQEIAENLTLPFQQRHSLWLWYLLHGQEYPYTPLISLDLSENQIEDSGGRALCDKFLSPFTLTLNNNPINATILQNCGALTSDAHSLRFSSPYLLPYYFYRNIQQFITSIELKHSIYKIYASHLVSSSDENPIKTNESRALVVSNAEVIEPSEHSHFDFYPSLLHICEAFLHAFSQSAWLTAIPIFAGEVLYHSGRYSRHEIEKFNQELQTLLIVSITNSPQAMAASLLARWLAGRLMDSPQFISQMGLMVGVTTSFVNAWKTNTSFSEVALETGAALMGSLLGSWGIQKIPQLSRWMYRQTLPTKNYFNNSFSFWSNIPHSNDKSQTEITLVSRHPNS